MTDTAKCFFGDSAPDSTGGAYSVPKPLDSSGEG